MTASKTKRNGNSNNKTENIILISLIAIVIICVIVLGLLFYKYFYAGAGSSKYGDRLDGIENYVLPSDLESSISALYKEDDCISKVTVNNQGKIIYIIFDFNKAVKKDTATSLASKALEPIGEENLKFYDVQFLLKYTGEDENENFPIFGSKNSNSLKVVW